MTSSNERSFFFRLISSPITWLASGFLLLVPCSLSFYACLSLITKHAVEQNSLASFLKDCVMATLFLSCTLFSLAACLVAKKQKKAVYLNNRNGVIFLSVAGIFAFGGFIALHLLSLLPTPIELATVPPASLLTTFRMYGRPLRKRGKIQISGVKKSTSWLLKKKFSPPKHEWLDAARGEYSSIAAFAKLSIELSQLGCPPDLLEGAHQAALDEIKHARIGFTLDSATGNPMAPAEQQGLFGKASHVFGVYRMALHTFADGCLHEARSARELKRLAAEEPDEAIKEQIEEIMAEEESHVALAWKIIVWCFSELKTDKLRQLLFRQLNHILSANERKKSYDAENRLIFSHARMALNEIFMT